MTASAKNPVVVSRARQWQRKLSHQMRHHETHLTCTQHVFALKNYLQAVKLPLLFRTQTLLLTPTTVNVNRGLIAALLFQFKLVNK